MIAKRMGEMLIVGAGFTGSTFAAMMQNKKLDIDVWEKSRGAGGRMCTSRSDSDPKCTVDVGAQYISATPAEYDRHRSYYEELLEGGIIAPLQGILEGDSRASDGTKDFVAPNGISSVVKHFLSKSGASVTYNEKVTAVTQEGDAWSVTTDSGLSRRYDVIVLTMPTPQILQLGGDVQTILGDQPEVRQRLEAVRYSSRFALGLFYPPHAAIDVPWCAKYVADDCVRFVAIDDRKRNRESAGTGPSVAVHTGVPFGVRHVDEVAEDVCRDVVLPRVRQLVPQLPPPVAVKAHKWRYSQVSTPYAGQPGALVLRQRPLLVCAGDAFVKSGFNGCLESALAAARIVTQHAA